MKSLEKQLEELTSKAANDRSLRDEAEVEAKKYRDQYEAQRSAFLTLQSEVESLRASLKDAESVISTSKKEREQEQYDKEFRICQLEVNAIVPLAVYTHERDIFLCFYYHYYLLLLF